MDSSPATNVEKANNESEKVALNPPVSNTEEPMDKAKKKENFLLQKKKKLQKIFIKRRERKKNQRIRKRTFVSTESGRSQMVQR